MTVRGRTLALLTLAITLAGTAYADTTKTPWHDARQLVLVTTADWNADHGTLRTFARDGGGWHAVHVAAPVTIGKTGAAWGLGLNPAQGTGPVKREGDNRSPAGVFRIGEAFGYAASNPTALPYRALTATDYCVDVSGAAQYNRIVDADVVGADAVKGSTEPMRRDLHAHGDQRYRLGFVIEHNAQAAPQGGSCIFAHLWKSPTDATAGCTAMTPALMQSLLAWLKPQDMPVFVLLPQAEYERLRSDWQLPRIAAPGAAP
ncbi:MAG TPA: L,D-transpeptidase family protein [Rhodanobacter sp.]|nr:L,D-transpeptidase family protein [Rhodanobacter sp.]